MSEGHLPPADKAVVLGVILVAHVALWMALGAPRPRPMREEGGAPVINLVPFARAQFDGSGASEATAPTAAAATAPPPRPSPVEPRARPLAQAPSTVEPAPAVEPARPREAPVTASTGTEGAATARQAASAGADAGLTAGGGATTLGAAAAATEDNYAATVLAWVERHKGRPRRHLSGSVVVRFTLDRQGRLRVLAVTRSSDDPGLDRLAIDALRAAQPYPRPPAGTPWRTRDFQVRLEYRPSGPA